MSLPSGAQRRVGTQQHSVALRGRMFFISPKGCSSGCLPCLFQEPTDSLEDSLLSSRPEFIIGPEGEEEENPATKHGENPGNRTEPSGHAGR